MGFVTGPPFLAVIWCGDSPDCGLVRLGAFLEGPILWGTRPGSPGGGPQGSPQEAPLGDSLGGPAFGGPRGHLR